MTYQLTSEEMQAIREMVLILERASHIGIISAESEKRLLELAPKIKEWIK